MESDAGEVYDVQYVLNESKSRDNIIQWIKTNSNILSFSFWGDYYDFNAAGQEAMRAFVRDVNSHKDQVEKFLQKLSLDDILDKKKELAERDCRNMADEILKDFGYVFIEHPVDKT